MQMLGSFAEFERDYPSKRRKANAVGTGQISQASVDLRSRVGFFYLSHWRFVAFHGTPIPLGLGYPSDERPSTRCVRLTDTLQEIVEEPPKLTADQQKGAFVTIWILDSPGEKQTTKRLKNVSSREEDQAFLEKSSIDGSRDKSGLN